MYSFKKFLMEDTIKYLEDILEECAPFIRESRGRFIYRGIFKPRGEIQIRTPEGRISAYRMDVRQDRRPADSDLVVHQSADSFMKREFNIAGRSQTVFVSGSEQMASGYGKPFIILPRGDFKFLWSPIAGDMAVKFEVDEEYTISEIEDKLRDMKYQTTDLPKAIASTHEIMIECKDYYAIPDSAGVRDMIKILISEME